MRKLRVMPRAKGETTYAQTPCRALSKRNGKKLLKNYCHRSTRSRRKSVNFIKTNQSSIGPGVLKLNPRLLHSAQKDFVAVVGLEPTTLRGLIPPAMRASHHSQQGTFIDAGGPHTRCGLIATAPSERRANRCFVPTQ